MTSAASDSVSVSTFWNSPRCSAEPASSFPGGAGLGREVRGARVRFWGAGSDIVVFVCVFVFFVVVVVDGGLETGMVGSC